MHQEVAVKRKRKKGKIRESAITRKRRNKKFEGIKTQEHRRI